MIIRTKTGKEIETLWAAVSDYDHIFRARIKGISVAEAAFVFTDPSETEELTYVVDNSFEKTYVNYTELVGISFDYGSILISMKEAENADTI